MYIYLATFLLLKFNIIEIICVLKYGVLTMLIGNSASEKIKNSQKLNSKSVSFGVDQAPTTTNQGAINTAKATPVMITPRPIASTAAPPQIPIQPKKDAYVSQQNTTQTAEPKKIQSYLTTGLMAATTVLSTVAMVISVKNLKKVRNTPSIEDVKEIMKPLSLKIDEAIGTFTNNQKAFEDKANETFRAAKKMNLITKIGVGALCGVGVTEAVTQYRSEFSDSEGKLNEADAKELEDATATGLQAKNEINIAKESAATALAKSSGNEALTNYTRPVLGYNLLTKVDEKFKLTDEYEKAIKKIEQAAKLKLSPTTEAERKELNLPEPPKNSLTPESTIWSITSEFDPIKEGGLGVVPVHVQRNFNHKLGIDLPTFIPMYLNNGTAGFKEEKIDGKTKYTYSYGNSTEGTFDLNKVMSFEVNAFRNGKQTREKVELYDTTTKHGKLYFLKNEDYFGNSSVYGNNVKAHEKEKFAFFSKAVYDLAKYKLDPRSLNDVKIYDNKALENLKAPEGMLLNDWQAAPVAAMARYSAPLEAAHRELNAKSAQKLYDMKIITVGHNATYQGDSCDQHICENVLNTLFEDYTADIVEHSKVDLPDDKDGLYKNVTVLKEGKHDAGKCEQGINMLNMGIALSDNFCPVSKNYAEELINDPHRSGDLQTILKAREGSTLMGVLNGNDRDNIDAHDPSDTSIADKGNFDNIRVPVKDANNKVIPGQFKYPEFVPYSHNDPKEKVIEAREKNRDVYLTKVLKDGIEKHNGVELIEESFFQKNLSRKTTMPDLAKIKDTPVFSYGGRAVSQKGLDILAESIKSTLNTWNKDFPNKEKPIFVIATSDGGEGPKMKAILGKLKKDLKAEDYNRVMIFYGNWEGFKATQAFTDFGLIPSWFEPCGLIQSEIQAYGGIPVSTNTGGFPNTIYDPEVDPSNVNNHPGQTGYMAAKHTSDESKVEENAEEFTKLIKRCSKDFFAARDPYAINPNDPDQKPITEEMAKKAKDKLNDISYNALQLDHSWIKPKEDGTMTGPAFEYLELFGMDKTDVQNAYRKKAGLPLLEKEKSEDTATESAAKT